MGEKIVLESIGNRSAGIVRRLDGPSVLFNDLCFKGEHGLACGQVEKHFGASAAGGSAGLSVIGAWNQNGQ